MERRARRACATTCTGDAARITAVSADAALSQPHEVVERPLPVVCAENRYPAPCPAQRRVGFRVPFAEPGVRLSIRTGLSVDVDTRAGSLRPKVAGRDGTPGGIRLAGPSADHRHTLVRPDVSFAPESRARPSRATYMAFSGDFTSVQSTASLRHVRGSPALRLLRRLRPSTETSPGLAACRATRPSDREATVLAIFGSPAARSRPIATCLRLSAQRSTR
jgi:hypothetical protein